MNQSDTNNDIQKNIKTLSRGLYQADYSIAFKGYKNLYEIGSPALPHLKELILNIDWSKAHYKELTRYVSGVFSLIHDMDETVGNQIKSDITKNGCPHQIQSIINSKCRFTTQSYKRYTTQGVEVFEHKEIQKKCEIQNYIGRWLQNVPTGDLFEISRLFIVRKEEIDQGAAGTYTPGLFKIVLLWDNPYKENSLIFKLHSIMTEKTLYHEIGHHVDRNTSSQHTSDREKSADNYAYNILRKNHYFFSIAARILSNFGFKNETNYYRWGL